MISPPARPPTNGGHPSREVEVAVPPFRHPTQDYIDKFIARKGDSPRSASSLVSPASRAPPSRPALIFYPLEEECPPQYYPKLHEVNPRSMRCVRHLLLLLCLVQVIVCESGAWGRGEWALRAAPAPSHPLPTLTRTQPRPSQVGVACVLIYVTLHAHFQHDPFSELFTLAVASLCAFAASAGFVGVLASSRSMLLFFYINQLWSLSNVSTFAVLNMKVWKQPASHPPLPQVETAPLPPSSPTELRAEPRHLRAVRRGGALGVAALRPQSRLRRAEGASPPPQPQPRPDPDPNPQSNPHPHPHPRPRCRRRTARSSTACCC